MLDARTGREVVERPLVAEPDELGARERGATNVLVGEARRRAPTRRSRAARSSPSGLTAAATFAGSVHGVVVQTTIDSPGRSRSGKRTKSEGSLRSW